MKNEECRGNSGISVGFSQLAMDHRHRGKFSWKVSEHCASMQGELFNYKLNRINFKTSFEIRYHPKLSTSSPIPTHFESLPTILLLLLPFSIVYPSINSPLIFFQPVLGVVLYLFVPPCCTPQAIATHACNIRFIVNSL